MKRYTIIHISILINPLNDSSLKFRCFRIFKGAAYSLVTLSFKGAVSRDFRTFFCLLDLSVGPIWTGKHVFENFFIFTKIFDCNDYADIVSA